ncbi:MAG: flippase-like domain-containing protein [Chloroflexi bacterium]|nr:MAG: flippase-like domain-containing protein [Chloroflexota bacterium]
MQQESKKSKRQSGTRVARVRLLPLHTDWYKKMSHLPLLPMGLGPIDINELDEKPDLDSDDDETIPALAYIRQLHRKRIQLIQAGARMTLVQPTLKLAQPTSIVADDKKHISAEGKAVQESQSHKAVNAHQDSKAYLMQLSGMVRAVRLPKEPTGDLAQDQPIVEEFWPEGIKRTGALPIVNLYGAEPFGRTLPQEAELMEDALAIVHPQSTWKAILHAPATKLTLGLAIGIALLVLVGKIVDIPTTMQILRKNLTTPQGISWALLSGVAFLAAFSIRGVRWKLFLNPIGNISTLKAIQLFLVGVFLNFLLPVRGGEVAKCLMLKRVADIPISQSIPTVAMDKALDLLPALVIMALVPVLGVQMDIKLWLVLGLVGALLVCLIGFIALAAWKRDTAIQLLQKATGILPRSIGSKIEGFATGFVDSLLAGASQPRIFIPAVLLTIVAVICDGLFAMLAFWTIGLPISFGTAIFGYAVYNMFYILPNPPGQVGSNETFGLLVFSGLLHLDGHQVTAMFLFSHPWAALIQTAFGLVCLSALGLTISSAMRLHNA